jgi:hypothetical protein
MTLHEVADLITSPEIEHLAIGIVLADRRLLRLPEASAPPQVAWTRWTDEKRSAAGLEYRLEVDPLRFDDARQAAKIL